MHVHPGFIQGFSIRQAALQSEAHHFLIEGEVHQEQGVQVVGLHEQGAVVVWAVRAPGADNAVLADRFLHPLHPVSSLFRPVRRHLRFVLAGHLQVLGTLDGVLGAGVHEGPGTDFIDRKILGEGPCGRADGGPLDQGVLVAHLF
jgi:hypothetical protein